MTIQYVVRNLRRVQAAVLTTRPHSIAAGPDGRIYFAGLATNKIGVQPDRAHRSVGWAARRPRRTSR